MRSALALAFGLVIGAVMVWLGVVIGAVRERMALQPKLDAFEAALRPILTALETSAAATQNSGGERATERAEEQPARRVEIYSLGESRQRH